MNSGVDRLMARLAPEARAGAEVNIFALLGQMTMDVVGTSAFGCAGKSE